MGPPRWLSDEESACQCRRCKRSRFDPWVRKIPWSRKWQPTPVFLLGKFHGQRSLVGSSPWGPRVGQALMTEDSTAVGVKWYLVALLICIALITKGIE